GPSPPGWDVGAGVSNHFLSSPLYLGYDASFNQLFVTNGGVLTNNGATYLGVLSGAKSNTVTLAGAGSRFLLSGVLGVGFAGSFNRALIRDGAAINGGALQLGAQGGSSNNQ